MEVLGEAFTSAMVGLLVEKLSSSNLLKFARQEKFSNALNNLGKHLLKIQALLQDADEKQMIDRCSELWLDDLRDVAYDLEDLLDEFVTRNLQMKNPSRPKYKVQLFRFMSNLRMGPKIMEISARLENILKQKHFLKLQKIVGKGRKNFTYNRLPSTSLVESRVFGRENDKNAIIELLFNSESPGVDGNGDAGVIPISGLGGVGKTTLAQLVYNDETVTNAFDLKAWVYVSEDFDVVRITKTILEAISYETNGVTDLNKLQVILKDQLSGKKFLLVLDDVWNENYENWCILRKPFMTAKPGSKIIVTTRNVKVGRIMGAVATHTLELLSYEDCISLCATHALGTRNFDEHSDLKEIGEEIVNKCKGLPLAVKTMGGLLRSTLDPSRWEAVLNSKIWNLPEERSNIIPALGLSYYYLPSHLKQLFAYCSIFPKDYVFDKDELILLWMAEGFFPQQREMKQVEDVGRSYFDELLLRSFFERSNGRHFVMHDLIHDLAQYVAKDTCIYVDSRLDNDRPDETLRKTRHLAFTRHVYDVSKKFKDCYKMTSLRTFIALPIHQSPQASCCYLSGIVLSKMMKTCRCLRSLCLSNYYIRELPNSIGDLKHLRYLNLSYTEIRCLPGSVSNLVNLETLLLRGCSKLTKLPSGIGYLMHLYCLDLRGTDCLLKMPLGIGNLTSLRVLTKYIVGKGNELSLRELKGLLNLRGELSIYGLSTVGDITDARIANLKEKCDLDELALEWSENLDKSLNEQKDMSLLGFLQPHRKLQKLRISHYRGTRFPSWIGDPSFIDMVCLNLYNCRNIVSLPLLGLIPALRELCIKGMDGIERVDFEFCGESAKRFPSLEILQFENMLEWVHWCNDSVTESFPRLRLLTLHNCPKLEGKLPNHLPSIVKLTVSQCPNLMSPITHSSLLELNIVECNEVMLRSISCLPSLCTLNIRKFSECKCLSEGFLLSQGSPKLQMVSNCTEPNLLWRKRPDNVSFPSNEGQSVNSVNHGNPKTLSYQLHCPISLTCLQIESCQNLVSFPETGFLSMLKNLILKDCSALKALPNWIMIDCYRINSCLEELKLERCCSLKTFPKGKLPSTLKRLVIEDCEELQSLPEGIMQNDSSSCMSQLEILKIIECPSLICSTSGKLPYGLKILMISNCLRIEPLTETMIENSKLLERVEILHCETLTELPELLNSLSHLTEITIKNCCRLKSFPENGLPMSLQVLVIVDCPCLRSFGCLPPNLISLMIWNCKNLMYPISKWNLQRLTSLREFSISGECFSDIHSFEDNEYLLPGNLVSLCIGKFKNLETLSRGLNNLTLLEELLIIHCHKLRSLPSEGLLSSLGRLGISNCPLLKKECFKWKGHIPCIELD